MKNKINNKIVSKKAFICYLEIFILITASFAFAFIIYENSEVLGEKLTQLENLNPNKDKEKNNLLKTLGLIILEKIKQPLLPMVSAQGEVCCERTLTGAWCQNTVQENCDNNYDITPGSCEDAGTCESGCCYNPNEGICVPNTYEDSCLGGEWEEGSCQNILSCKEACCIYGGQSLWATEVECESIAANYPGRVWDTTIQSELQCVIASEIQGVGACVRKLNEGVLCRFGPEQDCVGLANKFYENKLCTHPELETSCVPTGETTCINGKDGVYFKDSCGNIANIYDANKINDISYWETKITKENSCNFGNLNGNANSVDCGNCKYIDGSVCSLAEGGVEPEYGDYMCKDLTCYDVEIDGKKVDKRNGESWCAFDGAIGVGNVNGISIARDTVGSRYWRHVCLDGEERVEPCADYRNEVCSETKDENLGRTYSICRINRWRDCINRELDVCEENADCWKKDIGIDDFTFNVCLPKYPGGFDIFETNVNRNGQTICGMGTQSCHVVYTKKTKFSSCKCTENCGCEDEIFAQEMNSLCVSLGDCGGYINTQGKYTDEGYSITPFNRVPAQDINKYIKFASILLFPGQVVGRGAFTQSPTYLSALGVPEGGEGGGSSKWSPDAVSVTIGGSALLVGAITIIKFCIMAGPGCVANPTLLAIIVVALIIAYMVGLGEVCKEVDVIYTCSAWQPPVGGDDCEKCDEYPMKPCTPYRCKSLGKACEFINEGTTDQACIASINDGLAPRISPLFANITDGLVYENLQTNGFEIRNTLSADGCLETFTQIGFSIQTDEHAVCKWDLVRESMFSEMPQYFGGINFLTINHTNSMILPNPRALAGHFQVPTENILKNYADMEMFIECQDNYGNTNFNDYVVKFCIKEGPDNTPPLINVDFAEPPSGSYLKYGETSKDITLWINEPVNCRYNEINRDVLFENMENEMSCKINLTDYTLRGWPCEFSLTDISENKNIFIKCLDQPWLPITNTSRNSNTESVEYILKTSDSELEIIDIKPVEGDIITSGVEPYEVNLRVRTSGGAENGKAECEWREDTRGWHDDFTETNSIYHRSPEFSLYEGTYNFDYSCKDIAGNQAESTSSFEIEIDRTGPRIIRIYFDNGLKVVTNSNAECRYAFKKGVDWLNTTRMGGSGLEHVAEWQLKTYYIECEDEYNNKGGKKRVKAYSLL